MTPIFTLPFGEYSVADELNKKLKDVSVFIPISQQEKGIDLVLCSFPEGKKKTLTVQVKQSRTYQRENGRYDLFFNSFKVSDRADWFILGGFYPEGDTNVHNFVWKNVFLAFKNSEMKKFMDELRQRRNPEQKDNFFGFQFDIPNKGKVKNIDHTRGAVEDTPFSKYLLENRIDEIAKALGTTTSKPSKSNKSRK